MNISPRFLLQLEGLFFLVLGCALYAHLHFSWGFFAILFFAPDLSMVGYFLGKKVGAILYNVFHTYSVPILVFLVLLCLNRLGDCAVPLIWVAHIGFDRLLGFGIKYETAFKDTHLQRV
jgi:hypothetical protein